MIYILLELYRSIERNLILYDFWKEKIQMIDRVYSINEFKYKLKDSPQILIYGGGTLGIWMYSNICKLLNIDIECKKIVFADKNAAELQNTIIFKNRIKTISEYRNNKLSILVCVRIKEYGIVNEIFEQCNALNISGQILDINDIAVDMGDGLIALDKINCIYDNFMWIRNNYGKEDVYLNYGFNCILDEYREAVHPIVKDGKYMLMDYSGKYFNISNGIRGGKPVNSKLKNLYMLGDSRVLSVYTSDDETITKYIHDEMKEYNVINLGMQFRSYVRMNEQFQDIELKKDDIVIVATNWNGIYEKKDLICCIRMLNDMKKKCDLFQTKFMFFNMPSINELIDKTEYEKKIVEYAINGYYKEQFDDNKKYFEKSLNYLGITYINLIGAFEGKKETYFVDYHHYNGVANKSIASYIVRIIIEMKIIENRITCSDTIRRFEDSIKRFDDEKEKINVDNKLSEYINSLKVEYNDLIMKYENVGAVIMNCNPFTFGHLALVQEAVKQVDLLYVFVLEEDKSFFKFEDRISMVKNNLKSPKIVVLSSGKFIISKYTFPEYFEKGTKQDVVIDAHKDIDIFANWIAPSLNIKKRFVGQEPYNGIII